MTPAEAQVYAKRIAGALRMRCWSVAEQDLEAAALAGYVTAQARFQPPGDFGKYARSYMRGAAKEVIRQEARAHGLVRPHTRRCRRCRASLPHFDKAGDRRYCQQCEAAA